MTPFQKAIGFTLKWEGYKSEDPDDPGGRTIFGISEKSHPKIVQGLWDVPKEEAEAKAKEFYHEIYWSAIGCDQAEEKFAIVLFDAAVNLGSAQALTFAHTTQDWKDFLFLRLNYYAGLNMSKYMRGWVNRIVDLWGLLR